eukprot:CAMPEP_0174310134 /NCGR_PEP_ID=MMETSP0810-20121108/2856_1 /TAXON_ID=73025 ORGANISM="Eutreptiella gymnastica-like, Strain CCMP1594" /NCGR_SAMPLE_ID=MMETSP0810 /ASSEMBLY_ACC=CAM_ASM_000659 /LENGTH=379 /DNA_ID=CAMNT_0015417963 /DNA_START=124 /DNA_END=1264 /DNA_ORIENTATION=+
MPWSAFNCSPLPPLSAVWHKTLWAPERFGGSLQQTNQSTPLQESSLDGKASQSYPKDTGDLPQQNVAHLGAEQLDMRSSMMQKWHKALATGIAWMTHPPLIFSRELSDFHPRYFWPWVAKNMTYILSYFVTNAIVYTLVAIVVAICFFQLFRNLLITQASETTSDVISESLQSHGVQSQAQLLSKDVVDRILIDPKSTQLVSQLLIRVLQQEQTIDQTKKLIKTVFRDKSVQDTTKVFFLDLLSIQYIQDRTNRIGHGAVQEVLSRQQSREWVTGLFQRTFTDPSVQQHLGNALWKATWYSLTPSILQGSKQKPAQQSSAPPAETSEPKQGDRPAPPKDAVPKPMETQAIQPAESRDERVTSSGDAAATDGSAAPATAH